MFSNDFKKDDYLVKKQKVNKKINENNNCIKFEKNYKKII
ncbi:hypothetical protein MCAV_05500 [[Mycoplasma] cavipharyngis]